MIKFEKYEHSAFTGKKINKFGQKAKILQKNENAHEIRKKRPGLCPGVQNAASKLRFQKFQSSPGITLHDFNDGLAISDDLS